MKSLRLNLQLFHLKQIRRKEDGAKHLARFLAQQEQLVTQSVAQQEQLVAPLLLQEVPSEMQQEQLVTQLVH
jgi:hypothetical protein